MHSGYFLGRVARIAGGSLSILMPDTDTSAKTATFGRFNVTPHERRLRIRGVFDAVAPRYDVMTDLMSFGIHRLWKRTLARRCADYGGLVVDLAGGTGDVAHLLTSEKRQVIVCDPSWAMMSIGRKRSGPIHWIAGEAENLPFPDGSVDVLVISFGLRNATSLGQTLEEILRVLKPDGTFVCLEFSRPQAWLAPFYDRYSRWVIPRLGALVASQPEAYEYLVESIRRFPGQRELAHSMTRAGFESVRWENLSFGIACLHFGQRPR